MRVFHLPEGSLDGGLIAVGGDDGFRGPVVTVVEEDVLVRVAVEGSLFKQKEASWPVES